MRAKSPRYRPNTTRAALISSGARAGGGVGALCRVTRNPTLQVGESGVWRLGIVADDIWFRGMELMN
jgi:hypothetical protein